MTSNSVDVRFLQKQLAEAHDELASLNGGGGGGTYGGMANPDVHGRLSRLEGGSSALKLTVTIVSSVMLGAMAIIVALQIFTNTQVSSLSNKVDALPGQINQNLMEMNRTMMDAIAVGQRERPAPAPTVIVVPDRQSSLETFEPSPQQ